MKKWGLFILFTLSLVVLQAQTPAMGNGPRSLRGIPPHIKLKMNEFVDKRLFLTSDETKKFDPLFQEYLQNWEKVITENREDPLLLEKKIADLRIDYRTKFKGVIGEQKGNAVFMLQRDFIREVRALQKERKNRKGM